jgi:plastocyanin
MRLLLLLVLLLSLAIPAEAVVHEVTIGNNFFAPKNTVVQPGDIVRWTWVGGVPHSTTSDGTSPKAWDSGITSMAGFTFELEFTGVDGPGPFPYHCSVHALSMKDTIFVAPPPGGCCQGESIGDADCNQVGPDIGDVTAIITNLFITLGDFCCDDEADLDFSELIDIGDLTLLITALFITLDPLPACP